MAIIKCPECGHQISEKATVCPSCGVEIAGKITKCVRCGEVYFKDVGLCPHCYTPYQLQEPEETTDDQETIDTDNTDNKDKADTTKGASQDQKPTQEDETTDIVGEEPVKTDIDEAEATETASDEGATPGDGGDQADEATEPQEQEAEQEQEGHATDPDDEKEKEDDDEEDDDEANHYIDTDGDNLEKPVHEQDEDETTGGNKHNYIPIIVSLAITALIAAVCFYFYNDSKQSRETQAFELAMKSGDVDEIKAFLRNFNDASEAHKRAANERIADITKQKDDLSLSLVTREKSKLEQYLHDYPDTPQKQHILSMIDSIDWEDALKTNTKAAYDKYIADHANGIFLKEAKEKVTVKISAASAEDNIMAKALFREFFLSVNGNDANRLSATLNPQISNFMGTDNASNGDVTGWMRRQHGDDVSNVIWKLNHDYKITKKEQNGKMEYVIEFTAKQTVVKKDGRASSENFKIYSNVSDSKKISSMKMEKYTPQPGEQKPAATTSTSAPSKPASSSSSKPASTSTSKPASSSTSKPASSSTSKHASTSTSKPASTSTSKHASKPAASSNNKPASKPASSSTSKPAASSNNKPASKPASSSTSKPASKPAASSSSKPSGNGTAK